MTESPNSFAAGRSTLLKPAQRKRHVLHADFRKRFKTGAIGAVVTKMQTARAPLCAAAVSAESRPIHEAPLDLEPDWKHALRANRGRTDLVSEDYCLDHDV